MDENTISRIEKWGEGLLSPNGLDFLDGEVYEVASIIFCPPLLASRLSMVPVGEAMKGAFAMGIAWQKLLDSEEGKDLNNLLKDVQID